MFVCPPRWLEKESVDSVWWYLTFPETKTDERHSLSPLENTDLQIFTMLANQHQTQRAADAVSSGTAVFYVPMMTIYPPQRNQHGKNPLEHRSLPGVQLQWQFIGKVSFSVFSVPRLGYNFFIIVLFQRKYESHDLLFGFVSLLNFVPNGFKNVTIATFKLFT